jgi:hypothetical protein
MDQVEFVILDLTPVPHIDSMGCHFLEDLHAVRLPGNVTVMPPLYVKFCESVASLPNGSLGITAV